jgi:ribosomal protein S18 acetylase RimI-like enzyme
VTEIRRATTADALDAGRLLHDFNAEFDEPAPEPAKIAEHLAEQISGGTTIVLLAGDGPDGIAAMQISPEVISGNLSAYVEELYVVPAKRGNGIGRALMDAAMKMARELGATRIDLTTSDDDVAARSLYESLGFVNREKPPDGPLMFFYEREL